MRKGRENGHKAVPSLGKLNEMDMKPRFRCNAPAKAREGAPKGALPRRACRLARYGSSSWAICTALSAAPLRIWSATFQKARPWGTVGSLRRRPTKAPSVPARMPGIG